MLLLQKSLSLIIFIYVPGVYFPIFLMLFSEANWIICLLRLRQFNKVLPFDDAVKQPILKPLLYFEYTRG